MLLNHFELQNEVDSRNVAEKIQMAHYNLLRKIEQILEDVGKTKGLSHHPQDEGSNSPKDYTQPRNDLVEDEGSNSPKDYTKHFRKVVYKDVGGKERPKFMLSPEGLEILTNRLTGWKASEEEKDGLASMRQYLADRLSKSQLSLK